jgi:transcription-repair coupling factor (superfamily II helicase)
VPHDALSTIPKRLQDLPDLLAMTEGFPSVLSALNQRCSAVVDGAWGSSASLATAVLAQRTPRTLLVVLAHPRDLDSWSGDLSGFSGVDPVVFPAWDDFRADGETAPRGVDEIAGQRLRLLKQLQSSTPPRLVLTTLQALMQPVPDRAQLAASRRLVRTSQTLDLEEFALWLVERGYRPTESVELPGEFSRRGGIFDVFSPDAEAPYRLEFFGDDIESIRQFSPQTQRSLGSMEEAEITGLPGRSASIDERGHLCDYLPEDAWTVLVEVEELREQGKHYLERVVEEAGLFSIAGVFQHLLRFPSVTVSSLPSPSVEATCHLRVESVERFSGEVGRVRDELDAAAANAVVLIACHNEGECKRLGEVLAAGQLAQSNRLRLVTGSVRAGFRLLEGIGSTPSLIVLGGHELFHREEVRQIQPRRRVESRAIDSFLDLSEGDLVVHVSHGIARYRGMQVIEKGERGASAPRLNERGADAFRSKEQGADAFRSKEQGADAPRSPTRNVEEHLILEFAGGVRVYVPTSKIDLVQKYVGGAKTEPELSKYGGTSWQNRKARVQAAVMDLASDMIQLQALREAEAGFAFPNDSDWQAEFEASFPYRETPDQLTSMAEIKGDMQRPRPMDRLICGDVGYGKTELAVRAAFKAIDNGRQVAVLVPTTVLAEQHYRTFSQRLAEYPFTVECLSRFRTVGEQKRIVERLKTGGVDVVIGTHRLVSADVQFKDLGLVIIDEEQRFGVEHKERLKRLRQKVDVLTMTATPIPRTLHLSLLGIRDISNLETPPPDRLAIETRIARFDKQLIRHAILRELNREGQVYFVHNRVQNLHDIAERVRQIVPEARFAVVHGQMAADELEREMLRFVRREADILMATTIIESGLDIPNANTIFINQADNYGLADLHQLRGRVGRYKHRAYAYLLLDGDRTIAPNAARRLKAIEEFAELGAGFKIALRDLEIRGAGNILGTQQSGHIAAVGYEMYCQLLENAVRTFKKQPLRSPLEIHLDLPWSAYLPRDYVQGQRHRIEVYRRLSRIRKLERLADFRRELQDRFGTPPEPVEWLLRLAELRLLAVQWKIASIHLEKASASSPTDAVFGYRSARRIQELSARSKGRVRIVDDASAYFRLSGKELESTALYATLKKLLQPPAGRDA